MDFNKSIKENIVNLKSEINLLKSLQRITNRNILILKQNENAISRNIILGDPLDRFEHENDLRIIRKDISELEAKMKLLKSIRIDIEGDIGVEYVPFAKKKLLEMKQYMLQSGIDILRKRYALTNSNKDEVDIYIKSVNGFDTVRIEGGKPTFNIIFGYVNKVLIPNPFPHYSYKIKQLIFKVSKDLTLTAIPDKKISNDDLELDIHLNMNGGKSGLVSGNDNIQHILSSPEVPILMQNIQNYGLEFQRATDKYFIGSAYIYRPIGFELGSTYNFIKNDPYISSYSSIDYKVYSHGRHNITLDETGKLLRHSESIWLKNNTDELKDYRIKYKDENENWIDLEVLGNKQGIICLGNGKIISKQSTFPIIPNIYTTTKSATRTFTVWKSDGCDGITNYHEDTITVHYQADFEIRDYSYNQDFLYKLGDYNFPYNAYREVSGAVEERRVSPIIALDSDQLLGYCGLSGYLNPPYIWSGTLPAQNPVSKSADLQILDYDNYNGDNNFVVLFNYRTYDSSTGITNNKYYLWYKTLLSGEVIVLFEYSGINVQNLGHIQNVSCQMYQDKFIVYTYTVVPQTGSVYTVIGMINIFMDGIEEIGHKQFIMPTEYIPPSDIQYLGLDGSRFIGIHRGTLVNKEEGD